MDLIAQLEVLATGFRSERVTTAQARSAVPMIEAAAAEIAALRAKVEELRPNASMSGPQRPAQELEDGQE